MTSYEVYKSNHHTGDKKMMGTFKASSGKLALQKFFDETGIRNKKGKYLVIPWKTRTKYTIVK